MKRAFAVDAYICPNCPNIHLRLLDDDEELICEAVISEEQVRQILELPETTVKQ